ncbi:ATP-binding cassette sub- D member 3 [Allomyces arbusculus]|nr:ATP-binding cassette sub- D member 3 [Allomyces arbusculus]
MANSLSTMRPNKVLGVAALALTLYVTYMRKKVRQLSERDSKTSASGGKQKSARVGVNKHFVAQMKRLLPVCVPGVFSKEAGLIAALTAVLIARTSLDGSVVKSIVSRDYKTFIAKAVVEFGLMMWPLSIVNNSLKLIISLLALSFRTRLTRYAHDRYLGGITFYKASNLDTRCPNPDQLLVQDIDKWADSLSTLYSDIAKPIVDIFLFGYKLGQAIGKDAPAFMVSYFIFSGVVLRSLSPPFGKYTAMEQKLEGDFRFTHSRVLAHAEEIAFYRGGDREKTLVNATFDKIVNHVNTVIRLRFTNGVIDSVFVKYLATMLAYYLLARPVFDSSRATSYMGGAGADPTQIMEDYSRNSSYLVNLSQAVGRIILAGRDLTRFAGYTSRVSELFDVLDDIHSGKYESTMVTGNEAERAQTGKVSADDLKGQVETRDGIIEFKNVPIVTPNGDVLVKELSFRIDQGMNCMITGPNGCGKSSLFRILGDLWPLFGGHVAKPAPESLFYVPQKPYLALGTLRDQVIYPHTREQALARGYTDDKIMELLDVVRLAYLVEREGGFDAVQDWASALSGGEKQRVAMSRLFYHKPQLDECTSAVSVDVEGIMYQHARKENITLFTVSHRTTLTKYHQYVLKFDGEGGYEFKRLHNEDDSSAFAFSHGKSSKSAKIADLEATPAADEADAEAPAAEN